MCWCMQTSIGRRSAVVASQPIGWRRLLAIEHTLHFWFGLVLDEQHWWSICRWLCFRHGIIYEASVCQLWLCLMSWRSSIVCSTFLITSLWWRSGECDRLFAIIAFGSSSCGRPILGRLAWRDSAQLSWIFCKYTRRSVCCRLYYMA